METQATTPRRSPVRIIVALMTLFPALTFCGFCFFATPDLESWLSARFDGVARPDGFDGVNKITTLFSVSFTGTSFFAACLILCRKLRYVLALAAGPVLAGLGYLVMHGVTDPAWFTLLALLSIGMLLSSPVTAAHAVIAAKRQHAHPAS